MKLERTSKVSWRLFAVVLAVVQHDRTLRAVVVPGLCGRAVEASLAAVKTAASLYPPRPLKCIGLRSQFVYVYTRHSFY